MIRNKSMLSRSVVLLTIFTVSIKSYVLNENTIDNVFNEFTTTQSSIINQSGIQSVHSSEEIKQFRDLSESNYNKTNGKIEGRQKGGLAGGKKKKSARLMIPIIIGIFVAKTIILPLILKGLTFLASTGFILSKISLFISFMLALKLMLLQPHAAKEESRVEVVHVPLKTKYGESWDREADNKFGVMPNENIPYSAGPHYYPVSEGDNHMKPPPSYMK